MLNPIFSLCVYWVEMSISYTFFSSLFEQRLTRRKITLIGVGLFTLGASVNFFLQNNGIINALTTVCINSLFAFICFISNFRKCVFYAVILGLANGTLEVFLILATSFLSGQDVFAYNDNFLLLIFLTITIKTLYFLITIVLVRMIRSGENQKKVPLDFMFFPGITIVCQGVLWLICTQPNINEKILVLLSIASACLFVSTIFLFLSYSHQMENDRQVMQMQGELTRLHTEQSYYQILDQQNQQLMIYAHDAKKHLAAIQALSDDPQISKYVAALSHQLADYSNHCHSGNKMLDVMLHKYTVDCGMRGIQFRYDVRVCNLAQLDDLDLVAILGNLMDNAVTAAQDSAAKSIELEAIHRNHYSVVILTNSCGTPPQTANNRLISTKPDGQFHGYGLRSVEKALAKYAGSFEWLYDKEKQEFMVTVIVPDSRL